VKTVKQLKITKGMPISKLLAEMREAGVMGSGRLGRASKILKEMVQDKDCTVFMGVAGALVPGGMRQILVDMLRNKYVDCLVTTGATLTHDLVEALGYHHYQGSAHVSDEELHKQGMDRMWDSYMPNNVYEKLEDFFEKNFAEFQKCATVKEFLWKIGSLITDKNSILRAAYEEKIPLFSPGIADSGIGLMVWGRIEKGKKLPIGIFDDISEIIKMSWDSKKSGIIYLGGGMPKNFIQQALQVAKPAVYGVQITTDMPQWGGSSGAELREGISWGKMEPKGNFIDVYCDATIALPLLFASLLEEA